MRIIRYAIKAILQDEPAEPVWTFFGLDTSPTGGVSQCESDIDGDSRYAIFTRLRLTPQFIGTGVQRI